MIKYKPNSFINKEKVTYSSLSEVFELNFKKISRLVPLLPSVKGDLLESKNPPMTFYLICHEKSKYTGTYTLTHRINRLKESLIDPIFDSKSILMQSF